VEIHRAVPKAVVVVQKPDNLLRLRHLQHATAEHAAVVEVAAEIEAVAVDVAVEVIAAAAVAAGKLQSLILGDRLIEFSWKGATTMIRRAYITLFVVSILCASSVQAQYPIDALRFSFSNLGPGARAMSMGGAYVGVADDFYATFWNPAGLGQIRRYEFVGGFDNVNISNDATYLNSSQNYSNNVTSLGSIGIAIPIETVQGSLTFAIGYNRPQDFTGAVSAKGYNPYSSVAGSMYIDPSSIDKDMAYRLFLEDTLGNVRITGNVNQVATILEEGRLGSWAFAGAIEAAKDLYFGASLDLYSGTYSYTREIDETDTQNRYRNYQEGIHSGWQGLNLVSTLDQDSTNRFNDKNSFPS
jgi:hypothetical protein